MIDELKSNTTLMMFSGFIGIIFGLTIILHASLAEAGIHFLGVVLRYVILVEGVLKILFPSFYFGVLCYVRISILGSQQPPRSALLNRLLNSF